MVEFQVNEMSDEDLIKAANSIFTAEEKDFSKIKAEKWYQTLFHAITLNQDGKKYAVKGIHSLAKLQQLFMAIYVKNYRQSHEQLDAAIEAITYNSEAIKKLYGTCILNLEEQDGLSLLDGTDSEILALFLGEYRNNEGNVPEKVQKYNRGVLMTLQHYVPNGTLDNHQIRKLKNPKVVYRCFMEQCAVDETIETQEWSDNIYELLKDFELSDNSKTEIKNAVKYEVEIAGADYFLVKYSKDNVGILDTDFVIDLGNQDSGNSNNNEWNEVRDQMDKAKISFALTSFLSRSTTTSLLCAIRNLEDNMVTLESLFGTEVEKDIDSGIIKAEVLKKSIIDTINNNDDSMLFHAFKLCITGKNFDEQKQYIFISTVDGLFFFIDNKIAHTKYENLKNAEEMQDYLEISAWEVDWYTEDGQKIDGENSIIIKRNKNTKDYIRGLRKTIGEIITISGGYVPPSEYEVEEIVKKYIDKISKDTSSKAYIVSDFNYRDDKNRKRLKTALSKYAHRVREDDVIGFIDTSLFGNGGAGILFAKDGIAFVYAFEKIFAKYEEIDQMILKKGKELILYGEFSERTDNFSTPSIDGIYFDLYALKECIEEIQRVI